MKRALLKRTAKPEWLDTGRVPGRLQHILPDDQARWFTQGDKRLRVAEFRWPAGVNSLVVFHRDIGLTDELVKHHFHKCVEPLLRERFYYADALGGEQ